jgi:hypothetical protein
VIQPGHRPRRLFVGNDAIRAQGDDLQTRQDNKTAELNSGSLSKPYFILYAVRLVREPFCDLLFC